jgi:hypothetical protein
MNRVSRAHYDDVKCIANGGKGRLLSHRAATAEFEAVREVFRRRPDR